MKSDFLKSLNPDQRAAVSHGEGPLLVLAGPGSGKTRVIAHRIVWLVKELGVLPRQILAVTFTNKAAREMKKRVREFIGDQVTWMWIGTFHSICLRILKMEVNHLADYTQDFVIYDKGDQRKLVKDCIKEIDGIYETSVETVLREFDDIESFQFHSHARSTSFSDGRLKDLYHIYKQKLRELNAMTFNDLLFNADNLFLENHNVRTRYQDMFSHVLVDEYQDTNPLQYRFVKTVSERCGNIFVVGDENQSIYGWRGADITNILNFEKDFPRSKVIKLERNYRSSSVIVSIANSIARKSFQSKNKTLWTDNPEGEKARIFRVGLPPSEGKLVAQNITRLIESEGFSVEDIAVFYRANFQSRVVEESLTIAGIPYKVLSGVGFYQRAEIKDVIAYLRLLQNPDDDVSFERVINIPPRKIGKVTVQKLAYLSNSATVSLFCGIDHCSESGVFPQTTLDLLLRFRDMINHLRKEAQKVSVARIMEMLFHRIGYIDWIGKDREKLENVKELQTVAKNFKDLSLSDFLSNVALATNEDRGEGEEEGAQRARVSLMTIHAAKGLEFPVVFLIGVAQGLLPHEKSSVEEERRLFYVAVTRAEKRLYMSYASSRYAPSIFLNDLPEDLVLWISSQYGYIKGAKDNAKRLNFPRARTLKSEPSFAAPMLADSGARFKIGQKVIHKDFGPGVVKKIEFREKATIVTVNFFEGIKRINAKFLSSS